MVAIVRTSLSAGYGAHRLACLGHRPQHLKYRGVGTELVIGAGNQISERVIMRPGAACCGGLRRDRSTEQEASARADLPAGH